MKSLGGGAWLELVDHFGYSLKNTLSLWSLLSFHLPSHVFPAYVPNRDVLPQAQKQRGQWIWDWNCLWEMKLFLLFSDIGQ